ncbi:MAG: SynChlorMet cassette radical SAM/SPASM protein ScmF [Candidatus Eremiobacterota bacterium]
MEDKVIIEETSETTEEIKEEKKVPPLNQIYFYLTKGCNLRCRHCWIEPVGKAQPVELDFELFKSVIEQAKPLGLSGVKLTGGEPLFHKRIKDIIEYIKKEELRLTVETNGVLCTEELAQLMRECKNPFVSVSLDGIDAETHEWVRGVKGAFNGAIEGIKNLVKAGFRPQIIMTLMKKNKEQIEPLVRLAESLGAGSVKFNLMQPTGRGEEMHKDGEALTIEELVEIGRWVETELSDKAKIRLHYSHPHAFRPLGKMFGDTGDGCGTCGIFGILGVLADGSYALCGIGETVPELVFGYIGKDLLREVWEKNKYLNEIREGLPQKLEGICGDCLMKGMCLGYCIAQNYYRHKSFWSPCWYCDTAKEAGLFPDSRQNKTIV